MVKGGYIWVVGRKEDGNYIQCQRCGYIYRIPNKISIERSIIKSECPRCGDKIGLNCGAKEEDVYIFMNPNLDERYFNY
jgi:ribosomal protein L37E